MTACNASFSYVVEPQGAPLINDGSTQSPNRTDQPCRPTKPLSEQRGEKPCEKLVERLAARISSGIDEVVPFATLENAVQAITSCFVRTRAVGLAVTPNSQFACTAPSAARSVRTFDVTRGGTSTATLDALIELTRQIDVLILEAPQVVSGELCEPLSPRQLLELRARAPKALIVLDLVREDLARTPLTQAALLLPGTIALRGFGSLWSAEGAVHVANTAFVFGAPPLVSKLPLDAFSSELLAQVVAEFDSTDIDRRVQRAARALRERYTASLSRV